MAKRHEQLLTLEGKTIRLGKYSNNTEFHGDDWETAWTFTFSGLMLLKDELNALRRDPQCFASWFNINGKTIEPMPWWGEESFAISESFEAEELVIVVSGDRELRYEATEPDADKEDDVGRPACVLTGLVLRPLFSGVAELRGKITLHPGSPKNKQLLEDHQHREVRITLADTSVLEKRSRQAQLPLNEQDGAGESAATH